jgi:hypothetical protein
LSIQPNAIIALGEMQAKHVMKRYSINVPSFIIPCGVLQTLQGNCEEETKPSWAVVGNQKLYGYVGNLGEAHDANAVFGIISILNSEGRKVVVSVYGSKAEWLLQQVSGLKNVVVVESVPQDQLGYIDVHIVSLRTRWTHICVPSKAISAVCSGAACLVVGQQEGDLYQLIGSACWWLNPERCSLYEIIRVVREITDQRIVEKQRYAKIIRDNLINVRNKGYHDFSLYLKTAAATI